jgi:NADPH:quinone reductase-like Zn-dependent oxidoreductase
VVADLDWAAPVPDTVSSDDGTVLAMAAPCAMLALSIGDLQLGNTILVHGAAGSTSHLTVQLAQPDRTGSIGTMRTTSRKSNRCDTPEPPSRRVLADTTMPDRCGPQEAL